MRENLALFSTGTGLRELPNLGPRWAPLCDVLALLGPAPTWLWHPLQAQLSTWAWLLHLVTYTSTAGSSVLLPACKDFPPLWISLKHFLSLLPYEPYAPFQTLLSRDTPLSLSLTPAQVVPLLDIPCHSLILAEEMRVYGPDQAKSYPMP